MRVMAALAQAIVVTLILTGRAAAQPTPEEPALEPTSQPSGAARPTSQPASAPVAPTPEAPSPPPPQPPVSPPPPPSRLSSVGERCASHTDCTRPLWCVELLCQEARPPGMEAKGGRLTATKGDMQVGGALTITPTVSVPDGRDSVSGATLTINPTFGYFVSDGVEIGFSFQAGVGIGELYEKNASTLQIGGTLRYIFNTTGPVVPYLGLLLGPALIIPESSDTITFFDISFRFGLLVPLNSHVAINLGIRPTFSIGVGDANGMIFSIPIGWLGVEAFF